MIMNFYSFEVQKQVIQDLVASQNTARLLGLNDLLETLQNEVARYSKIFHLHNEIERTLSTIMKNGIAKQSEENQYLKDCLNNCFLQLKFLGVIYNS